ncbi:MAG: LecA/PA-IL family lectin [Vicinamibacterales bacterium]
MFRRMFAAALVATTLGVPVSTAERATFILTDGSRHSGDVVFHGSGNRNLIDNHLNLGSGGKEQTFPVDQVALIDFTGGQPVAADFRELPGNDDHLLVLRSGAAQRGKLNNLVNGDTVLWENEAGQQQRYAIRDVARIYLDAQAARRLYPQFANVPTATGTTGAAGDAGDQPTPSGAIRVQANQPWNSTGVRVSRGQRVAFSTSGQVQFSRDPSHTAGPDGNPNVPSSGLPVAEMPVGGLIARVGDGAAFPIGSNRQPITMPASGQLMLGINDTEMGDNSGSFTVTLSSGSAGRRR